MVQLLPCLTGHNVNVGVSKACALETTVAVTFRLGLVLHTQTETVILPPGEVSDSCGTIMAVTQIAPGVCDRDGDGDGLGDRDGLGERDGVRECDGDGLGDGV